MFPDKIPVLPYKISTLVYIRNAAGELLLMQRNKAPNYGLWSPIGGKLEQSTGESPYEAAMRETQEEIGLHLKDGDLHLFSMIAEKNYEDRMHWLMFLFDCKVTVDQLPPAMNEGIFAFHRPDELNRLPIPATDRESLWPVYFHHREDFVALRANCKVGQPLEVVREEWIRTHPELP